MNVGPSVEIYVLKSPETGEVRYVGKARDSRKRLAGHLRDAKRRRTPLYDWIGALALKGLVPALEVVQIVPESEWEAAEIAAIRGYRVSGRLLNLADGGNQPKQTKEQRVSAALSATAARDATPEKARRANEKRQLGMALAYLKRHGQPGAHEELFAKFRALAVRDPANFAQYASL